MGMRTGSLLLVVACTLGACGEAPAPAGDDTPAAGSPAAAATGDGVGPTAPREPATTTTTSPTTTTEGILAWPAETAEEAAVRYVTDMLAGGEVTLVATDAAVAAWATLDLPHPGRFAGTVALDPVANQVVDDWLSCPEAGFATTCVVQVTPGPGDAFGPFAVELTVRRADRPHRATPAWPPPPLVEDVRHRPPA